MILSANTDREVKTMGKKKKKKPEIRADTMQTTQNEEIMIADELLLSALIGKSIVTRNMTLQIPTVRGCINKIASVISSIPIRLYRKNQNGMPEEILEDKRIFILNDDTGDTLTATQFWRAMLEDYYAGKGGFAYINRVKGDIKSLNYVENAHVSFLYNNNPIFKDYNILVDGKSYYPFEFFKILRNTKDGMKSTSISEENPVLLSLTYASLIYEENLVKKGGNKRGFLQSERNLTQDQMNNLRDAYKRLYSNNSENVVVLNNGVKFQEASNTSVEMQLNENKQSNGEEICKLMGVPIRILTGGATEKDWEIFVQTCVDVMTDIECSLDRDFLLEKEKGEYYWAFDTRELMRGNMKDRYEAYKIALDKNFMQIDEIRKKEDLPPIGFDWITLGLDSVLYNPKTGEMYTPNTNAVQQLGKLQLSEKRAVKNLVITGPPGSGKTTWVKENMKDGDIVLDLDAIKAALLGNRDGAFHSDIDKGTVKTLEKMRDAFYQSINNCDNVGVAYIITTQNDSKKLEDLCEKVHAELKVMKTPKDECISRIMNDESREDKELFVGLIEKWFEGGEKNES